MRKQKLIHNNSPEQFKKELDEFCDTHNVFATQFRPLAVSLSEPYQIHWTALVHYTEELKSDINEKD